MGIQFRGIVAKAVLLTRLDSLNKHEIHACVHLQDTLNNICIQPITELLCDGSPLVWGTVSWSHENAVVRVYLRIERKFTHKTNVCLSTGQAMLYFQQFLSRRGVVRAGHAAKVHLLEMDPPFAQSLRAQ